MSPISTRQTSCLGQPESATFDRYMKWEKPAVYLPVIQSIVAQYELSYFANKELL